METSMVQHTTALVITPPKELWEPIQAIREKNDRTFKFWMPHITLDYPSIRRTDFKEFSKFLENYLYEDPETKTKPKIRKFDVLLDSVDFFGGPGKYEAGRMLLYAYPRDEDEEKKTMKVPPPPTPKGSPRPEKGMGRGRGRRGGIARGGLARGGLARRGGRGGMAAGAGVAQDEEVITEESVTIMQKLTNLKKLQKLITEAHNLFIQKLESDKKKKLEAASGSIGEAATSPALAVPAEEAPVSANELAPVEAQFAPHLTLGQFGYPKRFRTVKKYYELFEKEVCPKMNGLKFPVDKISFVRRIDMKLPMEEVYTVKLPE